VNLWGESAVLNVGGVFALVCKMGEGVMERKECSFVTLGEIYLIIRRKLTKI
jgi:hypothetical protein